jgi:outer membrane lipoprotein-sorting protein
MKKYFSILALAVLCFGIFPACAQFGGPPSVPQFGNGMEKLFGDNQTFSATLEMQMNNSGSPTTMSGKMSFDKGSSRTEMNMADMKGGNIPPNAMTMMKSAGLDRMVTISQSGKKVVYVVYPNAQSYAEMTPPDSAAPATNTDAKVEITKLGEETVDGHPCVKNKAVVTDNQGDKHEFTIWNATDLKNFPVKIEMNEQGNAITMSYSDISFSKPDASLFIPPTGYTKYDSVEEMMQAVMMKKMGGGMDSPLHQF